MLDEYMTESACSHIPSCTAPSSKTVDPLSNQLSVLASSTVQRRAMSPHVHDKTAQSMCEEKVQSTLAGMKQHSTTAPESGTDKKAIEQESPVSPGRNITCGYTCKERQQAVPVWHEDDLTYEQFVNDFMQPNLPVMIQVCCTTSTCCTSVLTVCHATPYKHTCTDAVPQCSTWSSPYILRPAAGLFRV